MHNIPVSQQVDPEVKISEFPSKYTNLGWARSDIEP